MDFQNLPDEILSLIIENMNGSIDVYDEDEFEVPKDLLNARLVCRKWNSLATPIAFHTIVLRHTDPIEEGFGQWDNMLNSEVIRSAARRVVINTAPADLNNDRDYETWSSWEEGEYPEFTSAISRIENLGRLDEVHVLFSEHCWGEENDSDWDEDVEKSSTRLHTLKAVFKAIQNRANKENSSPLRSLRLENLQNIPLPDFTSSELFKTVTKDLTQLHLQVAEECNEHGPDWDIYRVERQTFEPYMHSMWLAPLSSNLTELTLYFRECWGVAPGTFNGYGLQFPQLQRLKLGYYTIAHHDQLDWVLAQNSITSLQMEKCLIASYLSCRTESLNQWGIDKRDWETFPTGAFGFAAVKEAFFFPGTWESMFDKIRTSLTKLVDFRYCIHEYYMKGFSNSNYFFLEDEYSEPGQLSPRRYVTLQEGLCPSPWTESRGLDGNIEFGNNDPSIFDESTGENRWMPKGKLNRSKETAEGDERAFRELMGEVARRRLCQL